MATQAQIDNIVRNIMESDTALTDVQIGLIAWCVVYALEDTTGEVARRVGTFGMGQLQEVLNDHWRG